MAFPIGSFEALSILHLANQLFPRVLTHRVSRLTPSCMMSYFSPSKEENHQLAISDANMIVMYLPTLKRWVKIYAKR